MWLCLAKFFDTYGNMISTVALLITLGVLIWYALETRKLRKETVKQTELSVRPYVILTPALVRDGLYFENIGLSHALDVTIDILHMNVFFLRFQPCNLVRHGQKVKVEFLLVGKNKEADAMVKASPNKMGFPFFEGLEKVKDYPLTMHYKNIEGTSYYSQFEARIDEKRVIVIKSEKSKV